MNDACPPDEELERLLANQFSDAEEQALDVHVADCEACQRRLDELTHFAGTVPTRLPISSAGEDATRPGSVLAKLANSSRPLLRFVEQSVPANESPSQTSSSSRRLGGSSSLTASGRFLRRQFWTWPLIAAVLLGGVGWWVIRSVETAMRQQRINELNTVLDADVAALRSWMDNQRSTAELVAADETLRPMVRDLVVLADGTPQARSRLLQATAQTALRARLAAPLRRGGFTGFVLIDASGVAVAVDEDPSIGTPLSGYRQSFFTRVMAGQPAMSKPFLSPLLLSDSQGELRADQPCMYAAAPIHDDDGKAIAALGLRIRPDDQFTRILQVARSGKTGETYAFDRSGLLLSQSRFDDELKHIGLLVDRADSRSILSIELRDPGINMVAGKRPTTRRGDQPLTRMVSSAVQGERGFDADGYRDYRGVPVVGAWQWLDDYDFGVATEMDVEEAFAPLYILRRALAALMGLLVVAAFLILLAMQFIAHQNRELYAAVAAAQRFGQYTLVEEIGTGGMGTVYKARHALLRRPTAVKLLNPEVMSDTAIARFEREVQLTSALTHPNTVAIYDFGRTPEGVAYYVMEYLEGVNLDEFVRRHGPLPEARAVYVLGQVCASLAEAHAAGLVHRDVKPANIVLTVRGGEHDFVKVLDFGLAKLATDHNEFGLTSTNVVAGTPLYVSPEAVTQSAPVDARADVYAIGAVGYFLLTGAPVFTGSSAIEICQMHVSAAPQPPSARTGRPVTPAVEELLIRCLSKSPFDRPADAADVSRLLEACDLPGRWTSTDAAHWWAEVDREQECATAAPLAAAGRSHTEVMEHAVQSR